MENFKENLQDLFTDIEHFLTSALLEETKISITSSEEYDSVGFISAMEKSDIFLYTFVEQYNIDLITVLDTEWFGLLSSIMLGVEEKKLNEVTKDLLLKFTKDLNKSLLPTLKEKGYKVDMQPVQVLTLNQLEKELRHTEYGSFSLEVEGLADENVKAMVLFGTPDSLIKKEEPIQEINLAEQENVKKEAEEQITGTPTEVISGKYIEFEEFSTNSPEFVNSNGYSMDLLKDVEVDVSVELGRIQLPLGKVLQLAKGSVIELEKLAGEPVDILVNGQKIAHGEVVVIDEHFGVRISNLITTRQRIAQLQ